MTTSLLHLNTNFKIGAGTGKVMGVFLTREGKVPDYEISSCEIFEILHFSIFFSSPIIKFNFTFLSLAVNRAFKQLKMPLTPVIDCSTPPFSMEMRPLLGGQSARRFPRVS